MMAGACVANGGGSGHRTCRNHPASTPTLTLPHQEGGDIYTTGPPPNFLAGGAERDPGGAEWPTAESAGLRRRKAMSTSGWLGDRTRCLSFPPHPHLLPPGE